MPSLSATSALSKGPVVRLYFQGRLNDFLLYKQRNRWIRYSLHDRARLSDVVQSFNVPHTDVGSVTVNGRTASLKRRIRGGDRILLRPDNQKMRRRPHFILDVHLGKLARNLRMLGLDCDYRNNFSDAEIVCAASSGRLTVLTRDIGLLKTKGIRSGYWLRETDPFRQTLEVIRRYALKPFFRPFSRCLQCNGRLRKVAKSRVRYRLPEKTQLFFKHFHQCESCGKVFWRGSHWQRMEKLVKKIERKKK